MAAAARSVRGQLRAGPTGRDGSAHGGIALLMQRAHALMPVGRKVGVVWDECARAARVAGEHIDELLEWSVVQLGQPEPALFYEIDGKPITAGRNRPADRELLPQCFPGLDCVCERRSLAVPHDWVATLVEPGVR